MCIYYGITVGPIVKTLGMTNKPAGLWAASYMFSYITKYLLTELKERGVEILLPYFGKVYDSNEIGSYPDHIIFKGDLEDEVINTIIKQAKQSLADLIGFALFGENIDAEEQKNIREYMGKYISVQCVKAEIENDHKVLEEMNRLFDNIELSESYVNVDYNQYLAKLFSGDGNEGSASYIKKLIEQLRIGGMVGPQVERKDKSLKDVKSICNIRKLSERKLSDYYAIIYADGDNMSSILGDIDSSKLKRFSKLCLDFTSLAAKKIKQYGGVTIYAGGDDLLFIAPLCSKEADAKDNRISIFRLCKQLNEIFIESMKKLDDNAKVSLSFGISIAFVRSPLYEALNTARYMLFDNAKKINKDKNAIAISLSKASGQSLSMVFSQDSPLFKEWLDFLEKHYINTKDKKKEERVNDSEEEYGVKDLPSVDEEKVQLDEEKINSLLYMMEDYYALFKQATKHNAVSNFFTNMMDNTHQKEYQIYINEVSRLYELLQDAEKNGLFKALDDKVKKDTSLSGILRLAKFYIEKSGQEKGGEKK